MYYIILDTETTNDIECPIVYDCGFAVIDEQGNVYESYSFVNSDIFLDNDIMQYAYFADKIPEYWKQIKNGSRILTNFYNIKRIFRLVYYKYDCQGVIAHNVRFDYMSLNTTQRYQTTSKYRYFFPYGVKYIDTLKMARKVFRNDNEYDKFCSEHDYKTKNGQNRYTAEIIYQFLTKDTDFVESHTGLEDCMIEKEIFRYCASKMDITDGYLW